MGEKATLEIQQGKQNISYQIPVSEKQDLQERLADLVTREQAEIPQLGILALTLDDRLLPVFPQLRNRFGVVVAAKESEGAYIGEGPLPGDVIYSVNETLVDSVDSLRSALDVLKAAGSYCKLSAWEVFTMLFLQLKSDLIHSSLALFQFPKTPNDILFRPAPGPRGSKNCDRDLMTAAMNDPLS